MESGGKKIRKKLSTADILPGFELLNTVCIGVDSFSIALNIGLIVLLRVRQTTALDRRTVRFAIAFAVLSIIFASCHLLTQPYEAIFDSVGLSFAGSFLHDSPAVWYLMSFGVSPCYIALLECGAFSFFYKYAATCNKPLYARFNDPFFVGGLSAVAALWLGLYTYFGVFFAPTQALREKVAIALNDRFQTDFRNLDVHISGIDINEFESSEQGIMPLIATLNLISIIFCCLGTMFWCGWRIQRMIVTNKMSERVKKVHKQALRLLILQTSNPVFFVVFPVLMPLGLIQSGVTMPDYFSQFNAYTLLLFPLLNPVIFVICSKDHRNWLMWRCCGIKKTSPKTITSFSRNDF